MGVSTDGQISYGLLLTEDQELPWDEEPYEGDIEEWWCYEVLGFTPSTSDEEIEVIIEEEEAFIKRNGKIPISLVNACSGDYPTWIIAIPESILTASRGFPQIFNPMTLAENAPLKWNGILTNFCKHHGVKYTGVPQWYLSSYWG